MPQSITDPRYFFVCESHDAVADILRTYQMLFFLPDKSIELADLKTKKIILKRCTLPNELDISQLFIGSTLTVYSRKLRIIDYGDAMTRTVLSTNNEEQIVILPHVTEGSEKSSVFTSFLQHITGELTCRIRNLTIIDLNQNTHIFDALPNFYLSKGLVGAALLVMSNAEQEISIFLQKYYSDSQSWISTHNTSDLTTVIFEPSNLKCSAQFQNCTVCLVKPHITSNASTAAQLMNMIQNKYGFTITAILVINMTPSDANDFFEVYKGVLPEYRSLCEHVCSGTSWALEICTEDSVRKFRALAGPHDPEIAKLVRPKTLRAQYGINKILNGLHCTDLEEDGVLESEFFFDLMWNSHRNK